MVQGSIPHPGRQFQAGAMGLPLDPERGGRGIDPRWGCFGVQISVFARRSVHLRLADATNGAENVRGGVLALELE